MKKFIIPLFVVLSSCTKISTPSHAFERDHWELETNITDVDFPQCSLSSMYSGPWRSSMISTSNRNFAYPDCFISWEEALNIYDQEWLKCYGTESSSTYEKHSENNFNAFQPFILKSDFSTSAFDAVTSSMEWKYFNALLSPEHGYWYAYEITSTSIAFRHSKTLLSYEYGTPKPEYDSQVTFKLINPHRVDE